MPLFLSGKEFHNDLEVSGCLAIKVPLEGGAETRLLRRLKTAGYKTQMTSARGFGDPEVFLFQDKYKVFSKDLTARAGFH